MRLLIDRLPYIRMLRKRVDDAGAYLPGHFYSPIPNREEVAEVVSRVSSEHDHNTEILGISLKSKDQFELLKVFETFYKDLPFPDKKTAGCRYYNEGSPYPYPDAIFLYSFLRHTKPQHIIEVGSGFSSAVILDTVDRFFLKPPKITCIEPNPITLKQLLRPDDTKKVTVLTERVQDIPIDLFLSLNSGDLLFIDSSHVLKCGSDLSFLLFDVLPRLQVGVYVHFHDIFLPFEYPAEWLLKGVYWNEAYFLRAFLSNNSSWKICFFNNYVRTVYSDFLAERMPLCLKDIGGSLYIRKISQD